MRKSESLVMLGPVLERTHNEVLAPTIDRVWGLMLRAGIFPPPPPEIAGKSIDIEYVSMLATAQNATQASSIERVFGSRVTSPGSIQPSPTTSTSTWHLTFTPLYSTMILE